MQNIQLTNKEKEEGITNELLSRVNMKKKSSPVIFDGENYPTEILRCSTGYWKSIGNGEYERNPRNGALIVYDERTCTVARARYLLYHEEEEIQANTDSILRERKKKIQGKLDIFRKNIDDLRQYQNPDSTLSVLSRILEEQMPEDQREKVKEENKRKVESIPEMERQYALLLAEFEKGNYNYLIDVMGIEKIDNPVTFKIDNPEDMRILKAAFGRDAIEKYQGDVNMMYARLKAEQSI